MRVYYDFQILADQKYGGISRYFFELSSRLKSLGVDTRIGCVRSVMIHETGKNPISKRYVMFVSSRNRYKHVLEG